MTNDSSSGGGGDDDDDDDRIDQFVELHPHDGVEIKDSTQYYEVKCTRCHKTVGWSSYYPRDLLYCIECYESVATRITK